jgi:3-isopropylmalate/(R)-2-methylmalate dehydratase large subunit
VARTLFDKIWDLHQVAELPGAVSLLHVDRHLMHELSGAEAIGQLEKRGLLVRNPELTFATLDHVISTRPGRDNGADGARADAGDARWSTIMVEAMRQSTSQHGIRRFDIADRRQGIVHVIGPELGLSLPGSVIVCGDSHTCTHGAFGAIAWGLGSSELVHVLATQTIRQRRPKTMRVTFFGTLAEGVGAKDMILHLIGRLGTSAGTGHAVEFAGPAIVALDMEARMSLCNLSIEFGAKMGLIAPDQTTFDYVRGKPFAPRGGQFDAAVTHWRTLVTDRDAVFDREVHIDVVEIRPQITWGTSPEHVVAIDGAIPDPQRESDPARREAMLAALEYMELRPGQPISRTPIDRVFIGSCANSRLSDLQAAARVARGRRVAPHVRAWVVPGSLMVKHAAEQEGLDKVFLDAGFEWRAPGCSMCVGANGDLVGPGERCVSTSNRNFVGRQGPGARTHLASPAVAAASAIAGCIAAPADIELLAAAEKGAA